jgi:hypothetical protein
VVTGLRMKMMIIRAAHGGFLWSGLALFFLMHFQRGAVYRGTCTQVLCHVDYSIPGWCFILAVDLLRSLQIWGAVTVESCRPQRRWGEHNDFGQRALGDVYAI